MALTATYDPLLGRIRLTGTSLGATATYAVFDRTTNGVTYTVVRGGSGVLVTSATAKVDDYEFPVDQAVTYRVRSYNASNVLQQTFTASITQDLDNPWLKSISRPFLNREIVVSEAGDVSHSNRASIFQVVGRSDPVAVTDTGGLTSYDLVVTTFSDGEADVLRYLVTSGDVIFLQSSASCKLPVEGYFAIGNVTESRHGNKRGRKWFTLPLTRVAAPGPDVIGSTYTWASVLADYATWADVIAANLTWADLLEHVGDPSEVIVP